MEGRFLFFAWLDTDLMESCNNIQLREPAGMDYIL
jgi:hypothetical protein